MTDLTSLTPAEIDVLWAPIASREAKALSSVYELTHTLRQAKLGIERGFSGRYEAERAQRVVETLPAEIEKFQVQAAQALREQEPFKAEWKRRGGWTAVADPETGKVLFKTERGATNAIAADLFDLCWYGETHPSADEWKTEIDRIRRALAAKGAEYDYERALSAARKKTAREGRQAQF
jgi:hypothetical protein